MFSFLKYCSCLHLSLADKPGVGCGRSMVGAGGGRDLSSGIVSPGKLIHWGHWNGGCTSLWSDSRAPEKCAVA